MSKKGSDNQHGFATRCIHAGCDPDPRTGAVNVPIFQTSTYVQDGPAQPREGYEYSRTQNPTRSALEENLRSLEGGKRGLAFSSGMGAIDSVLKLLSSGDHVIAANDLYGGTYRLFETIYTRFGVTFTYVDGTDPQRVKDAVTPETKMIWVETPTNPLLRVYDLAACSAIAKDCGALLVVDNTFATPYLQRPIELGADIVVHSTTKYLGGHADVVGGGVITSNSDIGDRLAQIQNSAGAVPGPMDCFLTLRGIKTLPIRMERHQHNTNAVIDYLSGHSRISKIYYPGLAEHPGHEVAAQQMSGFGGMLSLELEGTVEDAAHVVTKTEVFLLAESLGGVESLIEHPASMTHAAIPADVRHAAGLADGLIRLSVGIEEVDDLIGDLKHALS